LITLNLANSTYVFQPAPFTSFTDTDSGCGGGSKTTTGTMAPLYPVTPWPPTFNLPPTVQPLVSAFSFPAAADFFLAPSGWEFDFTLNPIYNDDDPCKKKANSSVGCQNQSLGEDVPIVGTGFHLHYESDRAPGAGASGIAFADAAMLGGVDSERAPRL
jgi:hypothetical protein